MPAYVPDPTDATQPTTNQLAGNMAAELQALKGRINSLVASGSNFYYSGSFRNRLKNGCFRVAQRGTAVVAPAGVSYTLDQWIIYTVGSSLSVFQGTVSGNHKYVNLQPALGNTLFQFVQRIEASDCADLVSGTSITVSGFYLVGNIVAGLPTITLYTPTVLDNFGATAVVGASALMTVSPALAANTWQFFSHTFILSADATKGLGLYFTWAAGAPGQGINFDRVQLEKGAQYTPFEYRPVEVELAMCQRYYWDLTGTFNITGLSGNGAAYTLFSLIKFPVTMRVAPTPGGQTWGSLVQVSSTGISNVCADFCTAYAVSTGVAGYSGAILVTATFSAEI